MTDTPLDLAHAGMETEDAARLRFYERLADAELFLLLAEEVQGDQISPDVFEVEDGRFVLVFDLEERLAEFVGASAPYAALSGRMIVQMLQGQGIGLGVNLGVAASSILIPPEAVAWLHETLANRPSEVDARPIQVAPPRGLPEALVQALDAKLSTAVGLASSAYLVAVTYAPARPGHLLAFVDAVPGAEPALSQAISEALIFSGLEAGELDVGYFDASDPICLKLATQGLRFDLPEPSKPQTLSAPGLDPEKPPKLL